MPLLVTESVMLPPVTLQLTATAVVSLRWSVLPKTVNLRADSVYQTSSPSDVTTASDTTAVAVNWSVTGGNITDSVTSKGMHYGHYKAAGSGRYKVVAQDPATGMSDSATAVVTATAVPIASVSCCLPQRARL